MIPANSEILLDGFDIEKQPSRVHRLNLDTEHSIQGETDGLEAVEQAIYMILMTERYKYEIYSWNYGVELEDLFGMPINYACSEIERRVHEALTMDDRILDVLDFNFDFPKRGVIHTTFTARTIYGDIKTDKKVVIENA